MVQSVSVSSNQLWVEDTAKCTVLHSALVYQLRAEWCRSSIFIASRVFKAFDNTEGEWLSFKHTWAPIPLRFTFLTNTHFKQSAGNRSGLPLSFGISLGRYGSIISSQLVNFFSLPSSVVGTIGLISLVSFSTLSVTVPPRWWMEMYHSPVQLI